MNDMHSISKKLGSAFLTTSRELFARQYAISDEETIEQGFWRSTEPFADNDDRLLLFQKIMEKKFCPGGRILAGAGTSHRNTLNCFVLAPNSRRFDYLDDVEDLVLKVAATTKVGGGIGINFDPFRSVQFAEPVDIEIYHTMDPNHPDYHDFVEWQYTDITAYGQPKRRFDRRGALIVDYSEREAMSAPIIVVDDSISAIFRAPFDAVRTGAKKVILDWSNLRAEGTPIKGSGGTSSGAASFAIEVQHIIHWLSLGGHTAGPINALRYVFQSVLRSVRQGGCLPASAMVHTNKGLISIRDIAVGDQVYTFNGLKPVTYKWDKGVQHLLTLKGRGTSFTATPEHKMAVLRDAEITYVPMKSISVGDTVLFNLTAHQFDQPQSLPAFDIEMDQQAKEITIPELDPDMAWFIGYFLGNGSTSAGKTVSIAYNSAYKEALGGRLERKIAGQLARFGTNVSHYNIANENTSAVRTVSSALAKYIQKHIKRSHETLRVPEFIAKGSIALRSAFIAGLMDSDGSVKTKPPRIVTTIYPEFATELQNLLATLGIPVRFSTQDRSAKGWHDLHTLSLVGFRHEYNQLIAPFSVKGELQSKKVRFDYSVPESSIKLHPRSYRGKWSGQGDMGYHTYLECSGDLPAIPIKVLEVAIADPQETWDIEVAGEENFIANGFHTHNSRRGAGMATLSLSHPDRDIFLSCKDHEVEAALGEISTFNISFLAEDKDMQDPFIEEVAAHAWQTGDPGLLFVDTINRDNPLAAIDGYILSTNPCFTGDMRLLTEDGWVTFQEAAEHGKPLKIIQDSRITYEGGDDELPSNWKIDPKNTDAPVVTQASHAFLTKKNAEVIELTFSNGSVLRTTPDHLIATTIGMVEASMLVEDHVILTVDEPAIGIYIPATTRVLSITAAGREDVYCIHENVRRSLIVEKVCARRCGEIPLYPGEPCDLGAMNLLKYVTKNAVFNAESFANDVGLYVRYLDANLDYAILPTEQSRVMSQRNRRIGLGVMGLAHALIKLGLRYDSDAGRSAAWKMFRTMAVEADQESVNMSDGRQRMSIPFERKNIALLTVAPTGTTSMIMDVSSGIEPIFSVTYRRKIGSEDRIFLDPLLMEMLREHDPDPNYVLHEGKYVDWDEAKVVEAVQKNGGSLKGLSFIPKYMQDLFKTSHEIHYRDHIAMQAAAQDGMNYRHVGNSISKTINMPHSATVEDVLDAYRYAHSMGCKGITVYRDGSRSNQVLNTDTEVSLECPTGVCEL